MNWFERYGIVGAYFLIMILAWFACFYPNINEILKVENGYVLKFIIWFFAFTFLPIGYVLSIFSQWLYYKLCFIRKIHRQIFKNIDEPSHKANLKKLGLDEYCDEVKTEAIITAYQRTKKLIDVEEMKLLKPQCTKRFDVISINNSIILCTILSAIMCILVACFKKSLSMEVCHLIPFIFSGALIAILMASSKVLGDQIIEINKVLFNRDNVLPEKDKSTK